ncbi:cutinase-domain-containing protein [Sodiomyces alkalinus F11]|uniref:Cutinase-domain-containing protein n=1 Tax=Sodiomyces alkalinus (strain CBS 110278 / VKM F-3762 / F11) TaxID=1314773 RepID=A0A3N2Q3K3_SODAK|nr:cutinase-domain-containing protein [Sodiomyces alkalinus F11]ROT41296.1 cutinase-domain-containing protein [Sodiomyces alkalinus F11]
MQLPTEKLAALLLAVQPFLGMGSALALEPRQGGCPQIHIFGARETTVSPGYGSAGSVVDSIRAAFPGATSEAITYPACGGQSSCGGISYGDSARQGTAAVAQAVNSFHQRCPNSQIVLVGYSQGGQIMDNALCGGTDPGSGITNPAVPINASAVNAIKAAIFMGSPRYRNGLAGNVGTCTAQGFASRPAGFVCPSADKLRNYCDAQDPYCCTGNDANHHQAYGRIYGQDALTFVRGRLSSVRRSGMERPDLLLAGYLQGAEPLVLSVPVRLIREKVV